MQKFTLAIGLWIVLGAHGAGQAGAFSLRFTGAGVMDVDRIKIRIDDPATVLPGPPVDVGATDFTIEFCSRARAPDNPAGPIQPGANINWIFGNIVLDRGRFNQDRKFGVSIAGGQIVFGVSGDGTGDRTIRGATMVLDDAWDHVAVARRRSDGWLWLWVDGTLDAQADGPDGDVSYPDDAVPGPFCGGPCVLSDPFLVLGAEKHDAGPAYPSYKGLLDEVRISTVLRYIAPFVRPLVPFTPDAQTAGLYLADEGHGEAFFDSATHPGGPTPGIVRYGPGAIGPFWSSDTPFGAACSAIPYLAGSPGLALALVATAPGLVTASGASPLAPGIAALGYRHMITVIAGVPVVVDVTDPLIVLVPFTFDGTGTAQFPFTLTHPALAGQVWYAQVGSLSAATPPSLLVSNGLILPLCP
jgi:hypothetical protein